MTDRDLEHLKELPVPAARDAAKRAALDAALAAFDTVRENSVDDSQGNVVAFGPTETSKSKRSFRMFLSSRSTQAIAASVAALVIAAPFAFQHLQALREEADKPTSIAGTMSLGTTADEDARERQVATLAREQKAEQVREEAAKRKVAGGETRPARLEEDAKRDDIAAAKPVTVMPPAKIEAPQFADKSVDADARLRSAPADGLGVIGDGGRLFSGRVGASGSGYVQQELIDAAGNVRAQDSAAGLPASPYMASKLGAVAESGAAIGGAPDQERLALRAPGIRTPDITVPTVEENRDTFDAKEINPVKQVATEPVSTFSLDVDTASYAFVRRALNSGHLPPADAVRVEEMINYFPYDYAKPESAETPFKPTVTVMPSPWNAHNKLVHVAIKGYDLKTAERPKANLVFLIDVSGSMSGEDRLPLVKNAFRLLLDQLRPDDTVGIVTYASGSGILLEPTQVRDKAKILSAIDALQSGGSTAGAAGIEDAYRLAEAGFDKAAVNRIVLATDGDFNVGITDRDQLKGYIARKRQSGIFLSILGVGSGNHNDALMQALAQNGNGTAAYVDTLNEARKVLVDEASSTLFTIAKDVKVQIEWNPARISEYRLIGYETRGLKREDFNNDGVDAGDIGSGHTVTAIYEVTPVGAPKLADDLRYAAPGAAKAVDGDAPASPAANEIGFLKIRYKAPKAETSQLISLALSDDLAKSSVAEVPAEQRFSVAVAAFGQKLKGESYVGGYTYDDILALAQTARGDDPFGYRAEFLNLVRLAKSAR